MSIIVWIIIGGLAGWVAGMIMKSFVVALLGSVVLLAIINFVTKKSA